MIEIILTNERDITLDLLQDICNSRRDSSDSCYKDFVITLQDACNP